MSDIVERLRDREICPCEFAGHQDTINEAADEITRLREWNREIAINARAYADEADALRARVAELEEALRGLLETCAFVDVIGRNIEDARAALAKTGESDE